MSTLLVFAAGWLYVNFIEYAWHRWVLHSGRNQVHNVHHRAFFSGEYDARNLLNVWAYLIASLHVVAACLIGLKLALVVGLSLFSYLVVLEAMHKWQHNHPGSHWARWHVEHHRHPVSHFNVFLPVWDCLLGPGARAQLPKIGAGAPTLEDLRTVHAVDLQDGDDRKRGVTAGQGPR